MIYVNQDQLDQVEYIIEQSARGYHILFDNDLIRRVYHSSVKDNDVATEDNAEIEKHIENLILQPTLISKRAYLEKLSSQTLRRVVRSYFSIVENNIFEGIKFHQ